MFTKYFHNLRIRLTRAKSVLGDTLSRWRRDWRVQLGAWNSLTVAAVSLLTFYLTPRLQPFATILIALLLTGGAAFFTLYIATRRVQRPLQELTRRVQSMMRGDFAALTVPIEGAREIELARQEIYRLAGYIQEYQRGMRGYLAALTDKYEQERADFARRWQKHPIESLALLRQRLDMTQQAVVSKTPSSVAHLAAARALATNIAQDVYNIATDLYPTQLSEQGLAITLEAHVTRMSRQSGLSARFELHGTPYRLAPSYELGIYRIAQEALRNVKKHAHATQVEVHLHFEESKESEVICTIIDDGVGFAPPQTAQELLARPYMGLISMQERALLLGGRLTIHAQPHKGTRVTLRVPKPV